MHAKVPVYPCLTPIFIAYLVYENGQEFLKFQLRIRFKVFHKLYLPNTESVVFQTIR